MALRAIMLRREIERREAELNTLREQDAGLQSRESELEAAIAEVETDEQRDALNAEIDSFETERSAHTDAVSALENQIQELRGQLEAEEAKEPPAQQQRTAGNEPAEHEERSTTTMNSINIRSLPKSQRAFEALPMETRENIIRQADVQNFLKELRSMKGQTRGIEGGALTIPVVMLDIIAERGTEDDAYLQIVPDVARSGGGALPMCDIESFAVEIGFIRGDAQSCNEYLVQERPVPIIGRIHQDALLFDARTIVDEAEMKTIAQGLGAYFRKLPKE